MMSQNKAGFEDDADQVATVANEKKRTRAELLEAVNSLGLSSIPFGECTTDQLERLVKGSEWLRSEYRSVHDISVISDGSATPLALTDVDKKMLQTLLTSSGRISSLSLSRKLEIPLTTVQRRRKRLESEYLEVSYSLKLDKLGLRKVNLLISTSNGRSVKIGRDLLSHESITKVTRSIGEHTIDLHAEMVFKDNIELLHMIDWIKSLEGVNDVVWTEPVSVVGEKNMAVFERVLSELLRKKARNE